MERLKDILVPTERNGMFPRALTSPAFVAYLMVIVILLLYPVYLKNRQLALLSSAGPFDGGSVISLINASRAQAGLPALAENPTLAGAAADKAEDMLAKQYFAHISPDRRTPWDFLRARNYKYSAAGENLAMDYSTAAEAHLGFMTSATHRANILNRLYTEVGVTVAQGTFEGRPSVIVVQFFGNPKPVYADLAVSKKSAAATKPAAADSAPPPPPAKPASTSAAAASTTPATTPPNDPETSIVKGTETPPPQPGLLVRLAEECPCGRLAALALILVILLALSFAFTRTGTIAPDVAFQSIVVLAVLAYIAAYGGGGTVLPRLTPSSFSVFGLETI